MLKKFTDVHLTLVKCSKQAVYKQVYILQEQVNVSEFIVAQVNFYQIVADPVLFIFISTGKK